VITGGRDELVTLWSVGEDAAGFLSLVVVEIATSGEVLAGVGA